MTMEVIASGSPPEGRDLSQALVELQSLTVSVCAGAAADANIALTGFSYGTDTIVSILYFAKADVGDADGLTAISNLTSELQVPSGGAGTAFFQLSTTATTGGYLVVTWFNKGAL